MYESYTENHPISTNIMLELIQFSAYVSKHHTDGSMVKDTAETYRCAQSIPISSSDFISTNRMDASIAVVSNMTQPVIQNESMSLMLFPVIVQIFKQGNTMGDVTGLTPPFLFHHELQNL